MSPLKRTLGLPALTLYGLGTILGAGIYSVLGAAAGRVGEGVWLSFVISALVALVTALSYAELATTYPRAGAEYFYLRRSLPRWRWASFGAGMMMAASAAATAGTVAIAFGGYLGTFLDLPEILASAALLVLLSAIALRGIRESTGVTALFTLIEAAGLVLVIAVGWSAEGFGEALLAKPTLAVLGGASLVFFSFLGFENIANLAEEAKDPGRNLPRAILVSLLLATTLYVLVALALVALLSPAAAARSHAPLAAAVAEGAPRLAGVLGGVALFATANTALAALLAGSRILYGISSGGDLPGPLQAILPKRKTPWLATLVIAGVAAGLLPLGRVDLVASMSSFASLVAFSGVNTALLVLRYRDPDRRRPFRVPFTVGRIAVLPLLGLVSNAILITQLERTAVIGGTVTLAVLLSLYVAFGKESPKRSGAGRRMLKGSGAEERRPKSPGTRKR
jgi:APA family basic amino acid/polyamine antiporter